MYSYKIESLAVSELKNIRSCDEDLLALYDSVLTTCGPCVRAAFFAFLLYLAMLKHLDHSPRPTDLSLLICF